MKEKKHEFIEPAKIPKFKRMGIYDKIINEFLESKLDSAKVTYEKTPKILAFGLRNRIKTRELKNKVKVRKVGDSVYLERIK
jgi:hypothetical protein